MLSLKKLCVTYPDKTKAVDEITLTISEGESVALIGPNGAGKTSLIMAMMGVISSRGEIIMNETKLEKNTVAEFRKQIGVVFQNPDDQLFMPCIYDDIAFGLRNMGVSEEKIKARIDYYLKLLRIEHLSGKTSMKLSGGEKRMAALATVLVMEPSMMVFDEPTAFLDPKARRNLISTLNNLTHTKLIATHDLPFAKETCKRSILLKDGKIFADGPSEELLFDERLMDECGVEAIEIYKKA